MQEETNQDLLDDEIEKPSLIDSQKEMNEFSQNNDYKIEGVEEFIDTEGGEVIDKASLTPMDSIRAVAKKLGQTLKDPSPGCKHCFGRGWDGKDAETGMPIPCGCIYTEDDMKKAKESFVVHNRMTRRKMNKLSKQLTERYRNSFKNKGYEEFVASTSAMNVVEDDFMQDSEMGPKNEEVIEDAEFKEVVDGVEEEVVEVVKIPKIKTEESRQRKKFRIEKERKAKMKAVAVKKQRKLNQMKMKRKV